MKRLMVSPLTGKIYLTSVKDMGNGNYLSAGKQEDYTDEAIRAVFEWFMHKIKNTENANGYTIRYQGVPHILSMTSENEEKKKECLDEDFKRTCRLRGKSASLYGVSEAGA